MLVISLGAHGVLLAVIMMPEERAARPLLQSGEISVELTASAPSAPSPKVEAAPIKPTEPTKSFVPEPAPPAIPKIDGPLVLPAPPLPEPEALRPLTESFVP